MPLILQDFDKWKRLNKHFTLFDYVFQEAKSVNLSSDYYFALYELIWPKFILKDEFVFLEQNYSLEKLHKLKEIGSSKNEKHTIEFWMNLVNIDPFFEHTNASDEYIAEFTKKLVETCSAKLKVDFPDTPFKVEFMQDTDVSDYAITFYKLIPSTEIQSGC